MKSDRTCGSCSLCCKVMGVPEVKEDHKWCPHAKMPGGGCKIYPRRPERCRDFHCQWLIDERYPQYWYPKHSKIVIDVKIIEGRKFVVFVVDPASPRRWREEPWFSDIKTIARAGIAGLADQKWTTIISSNGEEVPIVLEPSIKAIRRPATGEKGTLAP